MIFVKIGIRGDFKTPPIKHAVWISQRVAPTVSHSRDVVDVEKLGQPLTADGTHFCPNKGLGSLSNEAVNGACKLFVFVGLG